MKLKVALLVVLTKRFLNIHTLVQLCRKVLKIFRYVKRASAAAHGTLVTPCCEKLLAVSF